MSCGRCASRAGGPFERTFDGYAPDLYAPRFVEAGADTVLIHVEVRVILRLRCRGFCAAGKRAGLTLCPETPVSALQGYESLLDEVLIMTVHPGLAGRRFWPVAWPRSGKWRSCCPRWIFR